MAVHYYPNLPRQMPTLENSSLCTASVRVSGDNHQAAEKLTEKEKSRTWRILEKMPSAMEYLRRRELESSRRLEEENLRRRGEWCSSVPAEREMGIRETHSTNGAKAMEVDTKGEEFPMTAKGGFHAIKDGDTAVADIPSFSSKY